MSFLDLPRAELESFVADTQEPADLDAFWQRTFAESRAVGAPASRAVQVEPVETGLDRLNHHAANRGRRRFARLRWFAVSPPQTPFSRT